MLGARHVRELEANRGARGGEYNEDRPDVGTAKISLALQGELLPLTSAFIGPSLRLRLRTSRIVTPLPAVRGLYGLRPAIVRGLSGICPADVFIDVTAQPQNYDDQRDI